MNDCQTALKARGICVIIPTFNNAGTIVDVVSRTLEKCCDVFVVCDGCTDGTAGLLRAMPVSPFIVELEHNCGKGKALKEGFLTARKAGFAYAITLDADGQHFPEDIPLFLQANRKHPDALIVGSRRFPNDAARSQGSRFANSFSNFWFFVQTLRRLDDTQTGYRLYPLHRLHGLGILSSRYEAELELLVLAAWHAVPTPSVKIQVYYPPFEERVSHFRPFRDFARISILNTVLCLLALIYALPLMVLRRCADFLRTVIPIFLFVVSTMFLLTPYTFIYLTLAGKNRKTRSHLHKIICKGNRIALNFLGLLGIEYSLTKPEEEDFSRPSVIVCNHRSHLDLIPMLALTPNLVIVTADWVWKDPIYGYVIRNAGFLKASDGYDIIAEQMKKMAQEGYSIVIYPEGTRSMDTKPLRFHRGAFYLSKQLGMDIIPAVLYGTGHAMPKHSHIIKKWPVHLELMPRIKPEQEMEPKELASGIRKIVCERYEKYADKIEQSLWR